MSLEWTERQLQSCFKMPSGYTVTGRSSSIRNVFVAAIVPLIKPTLAEIRQVLEILELDPTQLRCSYCGDVASEWDHLRPLVQGGKPTGFPSSIRNLVPSCGKCNQSKGKNEWRKWMLSNAKLSPTSRGIKNIENKIERLDRYEQWAACKAIDVESLVTSGRLTQYYSLQREILVKMREAQDLAVEIAQEIKSNNS